MTGLRALRDFRGATIELEFKVCNRKAEIDRKALVKQHGAILSFAQLRRRLTVGCSKMNNDDGIDRCGTRFPSLIQAAVSFKKEDA